MRTIKFKETPNGSMQIYNQKFREMDLNEAIESSQVLSQYAPYGYTMFLLCKETATIYACK